MFEQAENESGVDFYTIDIQVIESIKKTYPDHPANGLKSLRGTRMVSRKAPDRSFKVSGPGFWAYSFLS